MNKHFLRIVAILLISLMLIPTVPSVAASKLNKVVVVGSIDPSLGYDEIVNGTTTFRVARTRPVSERTFYHNVTKFEWKHSSVEASPETPGSYYDNLTGKYYCDTLVAEPYELTVPDPSGKVTVFSNMVFQGTGWNPKSKRILHPDGTSQSILHVKGQRSGDSYPRYLVVTIYNSKYPSGYQVDYTVVASSFDKSYDVTDIVTKRGVNNVSIVVTTYVGKWDVQSYFWVSTVGTDVYIVMIPDVPTCYVSDMEAVRRGVETACMVTPLVHLDTWKGLTYLEVVDIPTYQYIIEHPENVRPPGFHGETGIIVVNAHGEVFPVPTGYTWDQWIDTISLAVQTKGVTWVQVAGWPFYYYSSGSSTKTQVGSSGFQRFLQRILGSNTIDCLPNQEGYAVPLQGGYDNRLWGYGLIDGGLHEGRPLKIDSSTNIADLLDVMGYRSGGIEYLTLGLIGFAYPNQNVTPDQQVGYYVHNGGNWDDNDYNKGKYSMAVAAWTKISILASNWTDIYVKDITDLTYYLGKVKCQVAWSYAIPPQSSTDTWKIRLVTSTIAYLWHDFYAGPFGSSVLVDGNAPLKISGVASETSFQLIEDQSTTLYDASETSWPNTKAQGVLYTAVAVILIPFTAGTSWVAVAVTVGLGFAQTVTAIAFESPSPVTSGPYIDLALKDNSNVYMQDSGGNYYGQFQSFGVTETSLKQSPNGGSSETLTFKLGQKGQYYNLDNNYYFWTEGGILSFQRTIVVEPYLSDDSNQQPQTPQTPSGPDSGYRHTSYTYSTSTNDPEDDDVRYIFYWGDGSSTSTNWYESGNTVSASHQWSNLGTYQVQVQAQDCQGAYTALSSSLVVNIVNRPTLTVKTCTTPGGSEISNVKVWIDGVQYYSPVTLEVDAGTYTVKVESYFFRNEWWIYTFDRWEDGSTDNPRSVPVNNDMTITAYYTEDYLCPTLFVWNGSQYVYETLLDIHGDSDVTVQHEIQAALALENGVYKLQLRELDDFTSHIDQVKLYAVDDGGEWHGCPLTYAYHNLLGKVKPTLRFDDDNRVDLKPTEVIDLEFAPPISYDKTAYFIFEINGFNKKYNP